jgi:hypothetical protein
MKFETELEYAGLTLLVNGSLSSEDELQVNSISLWNGKNYVKVEANTYKFANDMEDYIRESIEQDAESARDNYYEDLYDERKVEGL